MDNKAKKVDYLKIWGNDEFARKSLSKTYFITSVA